jgi:Ca-activated chloride channel homolog
VTKVLFLLFSLALLFSVHSPAFAQKDDDTISVDSSIVLMNVAVEDGAGRAVRGLPQKLFHVFEDGVEQEIKTFQAEESPFAAVILLDTSGSMEQRVVLARSAAIQFLGGIRAIDNVAIYNFDSKVKLVQEFSNSRDMLEQIYDLKADGMTVLNDAVFKAAEELSRRPEKRRAIVVLSDGADTLSKHSGDKAVKAAMASGATIFTVDMSPLDAKPGDIIQSRSALKSFAEKTGGRFIATPGGAAMRDAFKSIVDELGVQYTIAYEPKNNAKDGKWRAIELKVAKPGLTIRTRKGYNAPKK